MASRFLIESRPSRFIVGMALGWDTAVAIACVRNGIPFVAAVPFEGQERSWPRDSQERYRFLLAHAERVHVVCTIAPEYMDRTWWVADAMTARNAWMVDNCDAVAALWDGSDRGGTANCVRYARSAGKPVMNLWDKFVG